MGIEKQVSKGGGGYVGGFFQLFDWNAKSRKKLFSNKSELPERSKQGKKSDGNFPMTRLHLIDDDEIGAGSSIKGGGDYSCASSVTDDDGYGTRDPGVVARLMGLDSLPTSTSAEPYSTPFFDSQSLRDAHYQRKNFDFHHDHQLHSGNLLNKMEVPARNTVESRPQKMLSRPIEKFQTEILPPKSAKTIPITHHKLLSPIKSPGFIPTKNAAHIMEAAAKIIEQGPQAVTKTKMPLVGSSSVPLKVRDLKEKVEAAQKMPMVGSSSAPLKVRDLKEKMEAAQKPLRLGEASRRPVESNAAKCLKGQSLNKSWNGSADTSFRVLADTEVSPSGLKNKGKSISLAIQAKVNVQRREGLDPSASRSLVGLKEQSEVKSTQPFKTQTNVQKNMHKKSSTQNASSVLRQNNHKQNCQMDKDKLSSKQLVSNSQGRKGLSGDSPFARNRTSTKFAGNSKIGARKLGVVEAADSEKEVSSSGTKNFARKKRTIDGDFHFEKARVINSGLNEKSEKQIQSNPLIDRHFGWAEDSRKKGMDVVSFTFTAPMTRSMPGSEASVQVAQKKNNGLCADYPGKRVLLDSDSTKLSSSMRFNVIGGDALSILLEQKLRELTDGVGSSRRDSVQVGSTASSAAILQHLVPTLNAFSTTPSLHENGDQHGLHTNKLDSQYDFGFSSPDPLVLRTKHKFQGMDEMDDCSSNHAEARQLLDCRHPSPVSILEPSFSTESCNSSDSMDSYSTEGSKQCSSVQAQEVLGLGSLKKFHSVEPDTELSDSASSTSTGTVVRRHATTFMAGESVRSTKWELEYVKEILCNVELMFKDFALGRSREIINPHLFDQLESRNRGLESDGDEPRLRRKVLFDSVGECLDLRCRRYVGGGCSTWAKGLAMVRRKEWLATEVYKEILGWSGMGDCMVDELVDKDMSNQYGRWLDFEVDAFVLGVEIEGRILNSLVDEVVDDILLF